MTVKIYKPTKTAMQSGKAKTKKWVLEFENEGTRYIDPIMGWTGNTDTKQQLRISFDSRDDAVRYAKRHKLSYKILEPKSRHTILRSYADNFTN